MYLEILIFLCVALSLGWGMVALSWIKGKKNAYPEKNKPFECGMDTVSLPKDTTFHVRFILFALLFVIFDIEIVLLFPWVLCWHTLPFQAWAYTMGFVTILGLGLAYEWKKLSW